MTVAVVYSSRVGRSQSFVSVKCRRRPFVNLMRRVGVTESGVFVPALAVGRQRMPESHRPPEARRGGLVSADDIDRRDRPG